MIPAAALLLIAGTAVIWLRVRHYRRWFSLPARRTDRLECRGSHQAMSVCLHPTGFDVPPGVELRGRTVFVYMAVRSSTLGHLLDPFVEMQLGAHMQRQYFERGCRGMRYLNLTHLLSEAEDEVPRRIELRAQLLGWGSEASLLLFEAPTADTSNLLVLAPHPDDAEAAAFGMYSEKDACLVTVTAGERATGTIPVWVGERSRSHWAAKLRVADSLTPDSTRQRVSLVFPDAALESMHREPGRPRRLDCEATLPRAKLRSKNTMAQVQTAVPDCRWSDLIADLKLVLQLRQPRTIICPHPLLDGHSDHVFTAVALEEALRGLQGEPPLLLLYVVHNRAAPIYPLGPASSVVSLPPGNNAEWMANSIYSHPLSAQIRQAKYFALEAMHAARSHPDVEPQGVVGFLVSIKQAFTACIAGLALHPASLLRRACRPDEIYYVVSPAEFRELIERIPA
jgi:LmbE family N-acetylglucosaminyl deacetylase